MAVREKFWRKVAASALGSLAVFLITDGAANGTDLAELEAGECISADVAQFPPSNLEVTDCSKPSTIRNYRVVFTQRVVGERYPGNLAEIARQCAAQGGQILHPPSESWDSDERTVLCYAARD